MLLQCTRYRGNPESRSSHQPSVIRHGYREAVAVDLPADPDHGRQSIVRGNALHKTSVGIGHVEVGALGIGPGLELDCPPAASCSL